MLETTETPVVAPSLTEIIDSAIKNTNENGDVKPIDKETKPVVKKEEKEPEPSEDLSEEEITLAKNMLRALKDPDQAPSVIDYLAKQGGYTKAEVKELKETLEDGTPKEKAAIKDEIVELLSEQFGEEFAAKLAPAIKKAIEKGVENETKTIKQSFEDQQIAKLTNESNQVLTKLATTFYGEDELPKPIVAEMDRLMDIYKPTKEQTLQDYLSDIHALAAAKKGGSLKPVDAKKSERIDRNRSDIPGRIANGRGIIPSSEDSQLPPPKNLDEAIARASANIQKNLSKED